MPTSSETKEFFDRLEAASFPWSVLKNPVPSQELREFREFRRQCEAREQAGRDLYGERYLSRDNCTDATEEYADGALYNFFDLLQAREVGAEEEWSIALTAAYHAWMAHRYSRALRSRRHVQFSDTPQ